MNYAVRVRICKIETFATPQWRLESMMEHQSINNQSIWYDPDAIVGLKYNQLHDLFSPAYWQAQQAIIGSAKGRGTTWFVKLPKLQGALRHYRRGGIMGKVVTDNYLFTGWSHTRSAQELSILEYLHGKNVNVPRPIAARAIRSGTTYKADILTTKIPNAKDLVDLLCHAPLERQQYLLIGKQIAKMHQAKVNHTDLNIHNLLVDQNKRVWIIDFDKCRLEPRCGSWQKNNLDRLQRSFRKERIKRDIHWQQNHWSYLQEGYDAQMLQ